MAIQHTSTLRLVAESLENFNCRVSVTAVHCEAVRVVPSPPAEGQRERPPPAKLILLKPCSSPPPRGIEREQGGLGEIPSRTMVAIHHHCQFTFQLVGKIVSNASSFSLPTHHARWHAAPPTHMEQDPPVTINSAARSAGLGGNLR